MRLLAALALAALPLAVAQDDTAVLSAAVAANHSLFWNTYRPQLYHGIRPRTPHSLMTGLMWFGLNDYQGVNQVRHTCEQSDEISKYTYTAHDGRYYASEVIEDKKLNVRLDIGWWKEPSGRNWAVRVEGDAMDTTKPSRTAVIYHFGLEGLGELTLDQEDEEDGIESQVTLTGSSPQIGKFRIRVVDHPENKPIPLGPYAADFAHTAGKTAFFGLRLPTGDVWKIKDLLLRILNVNGQQIMESGPYSPESPPDPAVLFRLPNEVYAGGANVFALQKNFAGAGRAHGGKWGFDVFFEAVPDYEVDEDDEGMTYEQLSAELKMAQSTYEVRFKQTFPLPAPYNTPAHYAFAQDVTSNLIGGIGYYHGASIVDRSFRHDYDDEDDEDDGGGQEKPQLTDERELLTATPSRSFFPRGFYWDEGFHLALIGEWDNDLSLEILKDWVALIDEDGWVAREQILGDESRSKVPAEFQTQYPTYANPPTLTMAVTSFIRRLRARHSDLDVQLGLDTSLFAHGLSPSNLPSAHLDNPVLAHAYLTSIYPALRRHYLWFRRTQRGLLKPFDRRPRAREAYRWRGRTENHVLTSGLDDFPRARPPHVGELHLDLLSWVGFFARTMGEISEFLGIEEDRQEYEKHERGVLENLDDLHWSDEHNMYCDVSVDEDDESVHVCHAGYISLFPLMLGLLPPDHPNIPHVLDLIVSPQHLWSPYGVRSLSASHPLFGKDENYWRGPVWVQMNWLILKAIKERYAAAGPYAARAQGVYDKLRANVVENIFKVRAKTALRDGGSVLDGVERGAGRELTRQEYERTGYVWEQYDAHTGEGRRSHPFTGWTSLVTMIMTEKYS
ncbi:Processing alpha glucosidase I [Cryptotrichosporon argae]